MLLYLFYSCFLRQYLVASESLEEYLEQENKLLQTIFRNYSADLPATYTRGRSDPFASPMLQNVNITLMYTNLLSIDEPQETIYLLIDIYMEWRDYRLKWNPDNFSKIDVIMTGRARVWVPDVVAYDIAEFDWGVPPERQQVVIFSNGTVALLTSINVGYNCELDVRILTYENDIQITNLPFDEQFCAAKFCCYHSTDKELVLSPFFAPGFDEKIMSSNSWTALGKDIVHRTFEDKLHSWNYSEVNFVFKLRRSATYYVVLIIIPSYILAFLCLCGLFWSRITHNTYMEKLNLGYAGILAMVLILQMTTQEMVKTSSLPILSLYTLMNLSSISVASLVVLITGKAEGKLCKNRKSEKCWTLQIIKRIHIFFLILFITIITINLIMLLLKKVEVRNRDKIK